MNTKQSRCLLAALLIAAILMTSAGSIHAYLTAHDSRTSIFTISVPLKDFLESFTLREHKAVDVDENGAYDGIYELTDETVISNQYNIHPGVNLPKDPYIEIKGLNYETYLFVEIVGNNNTNFSWSVNDLWMETSLTGRQGGTVYVYKGSTNDAVVLDDVSGANFFAHILSGIVESPNGGVTVSDKYTPADGESLDVYGYLVQKEGFVSYAEAYDSLVN